MATILNVDDSLFRGLLEAAPDAMIVVDSHGLIMLVNRQAEKMFGYPRGQLQGQAVEMLIPARLRTQHVRNRDGYFANPITRHLGASLQLFALRQDGTELPVEISLSPLTTEAGTLVIGAIRAITERQRVEESLRLSEERFRLLVDGVKDYAILMLDPHGIVCTWNAGATDIKKYRAEEIIGKHYSCFYSVQDIQRGIPERILQIATTKGRCEVEGWRLRKDGSRFWANVIVTAIRDQAGILKGYVNITRDLTERQYAEEAMRQNEERMRLIIETAHDAFLTMDSAGIITAWNAQAEVTFGWSTAEIIGRPLAETLIPPQFRASHRRGLQTFLTTGKGPALNRRIELSALHRDGHEFPVEMTISPLRQGDRYIFNAFVHDITNRKLAEEKLKTITVKLQRSNRELQDFASVASHDLQEPLRKIQTFGDRLQNKWGQALGPEGRDYLGRMQNAAGRMRNLINDLLEFSRLTTKPAGFARVDLRQVVQEVLSDLEERMLSSAGQVDVGDLPTLDADPTQMRQLIQNLLSNALKFHRPSVPPIVAIRARLLGSPEELREASIVAPGPFHQITVRDNGIGFDEVNLERIFGVFQRLHGRNEYEGTGIGLAICRRIAERHGGFITANSKPGEGATFTVLLPANQTPGERPHDADLS